MIYLDTQVIVRIFTGAHLVSRSARRLINKHNPLISPAALLELQLLREIGRIKYSPDRILAHVENQYGVRLCRKPFADVVRAAVGLSWTRDLFDRLIVGHARLNEDSLVTKDERILQHYKHAVW